jgi:hypothetical protein
MQVPDEIRKCEAFAFMRKNGRLVAEGTVFFLGEMLPDGSSWAATITARHIVRGIAHNSDDGNLLIRVNSRGGGPMFVETKASDWLEHPDDESVDVAVLPWMPGAGVFDHLAWPMGQLATQAVIDEQGIGVAEDLFLTGLFVNHAGTGRNLPIVRVGNIAAMPEERVATKHLGPIEAYLVESRSIGGLSGSPVFVHLGSMRQFGGNTRVSGGSQMYLLGLMHGHWDAMGNAADSPVLQDERINDERINMGIAIVVPASKIDEVVRQPVMLEGRDKALRDRAAELAPTEDASRSAE